MSNFKKLLPVFILIFGLAVSFGVVAQEDEGIPGVPGEEAIEIQIKIKGITYPVADLGNCNSKGECRAYCEDPANMDSCIAFAKKHGLMNDVQTTRASRFARQLNAGEGPLGCQNPAECKRVCSTIENMDTCLAWAETNNIKDENFNEARKINRFLKSGGQMPGGCNSKDACETYCEDFNHADECLAFAEKVGLDIPDGPEGVSPKKALELMKSGQTPGGCKSRQACETYCGDESHFEECIAFAEKAGFVKPEEAAMARKTGGKGPGGCKGPRECETYCNDPAHQEECFKFAEEHGLIPPEELKQAKAGFTRMRAGLENAPPEVRECLQSVMGQNVIEDIQSGKLTPGREIGERMRGCFEKFGARHDSAGIFKNAPPEVLTCLTEKGIDVNKIKSGEVEFTPEMGDTIRVCFQAAQFAGPGGPEGPGGPGGFGGEPPNLGEFLRSAPPGVAECLQNNLGGEFEKLKSGEPPTDPAIGNKIRGCFEQFRPHRAEGFGPGGDRLGPSGEGGGFGPSTGQPEGFRGEFGQGGTGGDFPPAVVACLKSNLSEDQVKLLLRGDRPSGEAEAMVKKCFTEGGGTPSGAPQGGFGPSPSQILGNFPGSVADCIKRSLSESDLVNADRVRAAAERCFIESGISPSGGQFSPSGFTPPPGSFTPPPGDTFPSGEFQPPQSYQSRPSLLGVIFGPLIQLLNR